MRVFPGIFPHCGTTWGQILYFKTRFLRHPKSTLKLKGHHFSRPFSMQKGVLDVDVCEFMPGANKDTHASPSRSSAFRLGKPDCKDERGSDVKKVRLLIPKAFSDSVAREKSLISTKVHCTIEKRYSTERYWMNFGRGEFYQIKENHQLTFHRPEIETLLLDSNMTYFCAKKTFNLTFYDDDEVTTSISWFSSLAKLRLSQLTWLASLAWSNFVELWLFFLIFGRFSYYLS